ncbi:uncharacterized protein DUF3833 [Sphaerotilus hippei]|uniref:Uncharacterized protein DUF3833 n=1 Tax=Sphaerotilus hippei TaxID=744406 RepID=A0A318HAU3_9BURK|nr:DUF3833 domain-containing protein [Sphaerotilus hippei]PXW95841.1 uncharacterized protein DUF3833 [Sphaerotilus hippei]
MARRCAWRRSLLAAAALAGSLVLGGCAGPQVQDYTGQTPVLDLREYFNGELTAHGLFTDRSGAVKRRFTVRMVGRWQGDQGVLEEDFTYSDGQTERRVWRLSRQADGRYVGRADDVLGEAKGEAAGNALRWQYTLRLPVDGTTYEVQFDDWMYLMDRQVMLNRATMSKFGIRLGEVTLSFHKP